MNSLRKALASRLRYFGVGLVVVYAVSAVTPPLRTQETRVEAPSEIVLTLDPAHSEVHWTVDSTLHMVHGTFLLKNGSVHFNLENGSAGGEIVVIATSGESGNGSRDARMHRDILATAKYPEVIFRPTRVDGKVSRSGASDVKLVGVLTIHGADHDLTAQVHAELTGNHFTGDHWIGTAKFEVPYVQWGIRDPSNFLLKVKPVVNVEVEMAGEMADAK
jgi:polyisoprenoid-binding protein YceI